MSKLNCLKHIENNPELVEYISNNVDENLSENEQK